MSVTGAPAIDGDARSTLTAAVLGFFVITLDATIVNVALPSIRGGLGGGITGLQWVVGGYTLMFAALLLSSGALADRIGAKHAFGLGLTVFAVASVVCGAARWPCGRGRCGRRRRAGPRRCAEPGHLASDLPRERACGSADPGAARPDPAVPTPRGALRLGRTGPRHRRDRRADLRCDRGSGGFVHGQRVSLPITAAIALATAVAGLSLKPRQALKETA
ncbi:MFS transporter [Microbispora siamensis]